MLATQLTQFKLAKYFNENGSCSISVFHSLMRYRNVATVRTVTVQVQVQVHNIPASFGASSR
jgi:hypothetical protein